MKTLDGLAQDLRLCRRKHNKLSLGYVLDAARILAEAKALAKRRFGAWLRERAHMDRSTASRYFKVAGFVRRNVALTQQIEKMSITKLCALSNLDDDQARAYLKGEIYLPRPLELLSDAEFVAEIRKLHPPSPKRRNRQHAYRQVLGAITKLERALVGASPYHQQLSPAQRRRIASRLESALQRAEGWKRIA